MTQQPQPPRTPPASAGPRPGQPTIGELVSRISENISDLLKGEIELTKAKALRVANTAGVGAALLVAAAVRSEQRRVEKECQAACRTRWAPYH